MENDSNDEGSEGSEGGGGGTLALGCWPSKSHGPPGPAKDEYSVHSTAPTAPTSAAALSALTELDITCCCALAGSATRNAGAEPLATPVGEIALGALDPRFWSVLLDAMCSREMVPGSERRTSNE